MHSYIQSIKDIDKIELFAKVQFALAMWSYYFDQSLMYQY